MPTLIGDIKLYDIRELSKKLAVTPLTLRRYIKAGRLTGRKIGGKYMITEDSVRKYFEDGTPAKA